jgi:2-oxoglutarate ferredoxin oxidoreductase subunit beta
MAAISSATLTPTGLGLKRQDFISNIDPKWCAGCGCYSVLRWLTGTFPGMNVPREKFAVISGIGCSSRLPYYVDTFGFHTVHGRAMTVATGLKITQPDLSVWVITGDGDALSIGGNHFIHMIRRNPDIKVILFNNQIYGLTKGQASPTTAKGKKTKSTPFGSFDQPIRPLSMAIAAGATFAARVADTDGELMADILAQAAAHRGAAFVEVLLNCVIFNDGTFSHLTDKAVKQDTTVRLRTGEPLVFGAQKDRVVTIDGFRPKVETFAPGAVPANALIHDVEVEDPSLAFLLSNMEHPELPVPVGVFRKVQGPVYNDNYAPRGGDLSKVLQGGEAWIEDDQGGIRSAR